MGKYTISVVGMGYVGIASAIAFANCSNVDYVYGIQRDSERSGKKIKMLNDGINPFPEEHALDIYLKDAIENKKFECTSEYDVVGDSNVLLIDVQTPFIGLTPDYSHMKDAIKAVSRTMHADMLTCIESTVTPGSTDGWISRSFENLTGMIPGEHYYLAHAPERVTPGKLLHNIYNLDRCVGGVTPACSDKACELYINLAHDGTSVIKMTSREAEFTKTAENAIRDLQIATANQLALHAEAMGINYYNVANGIKSLTGVGVNRCLLYPGAGVGGHCLVKDTYHLEVGREMFAAGFDDVPPGFNSLFISAREINSYMPEHMFNLTLHGLFEKKLIYGLDKNIKIGILGWAFAENTSDARNTPTKDYIDFFARGAPIIRLGLCDFDIQVHDPYTKEENEYNVARDLDSVLCGADVVVGFTKHYDYGWIRSKDILDFSGKDHILVVDGRNMFDPIDCKSNGCIYRGIGRGDAN